MSDALHRNDDLWHPPTTFREGLADTERVAALLLDQLAGQIVVQVAEIEFIARKIHRLASAAHRALPSEVS